MSREALADQVWELAQELGLNTSPVCGCMGLSADRKYRSVMLGWARWLDAEIRIYSPKFFLYRDSRHRMQKLDSFDALKEGLYLRTLGSIGFTLPPYIDLILQFREWEEK